MSTEATATFRGEGGSEWSLSLPLNEAMLGQIERGTLMPVGEKAEALFDEFHGDEFASDDGDDEVEEEIHASPAAAKLAEEIGVDLADVTGTGKGGSITKGDVEGAAPGASSSGAPDEDEQGDGGSQD